MKAATRAIRANEIYFEASLTYFEVVPVTSLLSITTPILLKINLTSIRLILK